MAEATEPTAALPLRWGRYRTRWLGGLALIVGGAVGLQGANPRILLLLLAGTAAHALGWAIMPADGWRRLVVVVPGIAAIWLLLTGPQSVWLLIAPFIGWLVVRHRPLRSYWSVIPVVAAGILIPQFFREYRSMLIALGIMTVVLIGSAWLARVIALSARTSSKLPAQFR